MVQVLMQLSGMVRLHQQYLVAESMIQILQMDS